jgi:hypothetical protein
MYHYVDGGRRCLPGEWPRTEPKVFEDEGSVTIYDAPPPGEAPTAYPSPC